jgi:hypothetical protein
MYRYGPHLGGDARAGNRCGGHPWFGATVESCERYDENCFDPGCDWYPLDRVARAVAEVVGREPASRWRWRPRLDFTRDGPSCALVPRT